MTRLMTFSNFKRLTDNHYKNSGANKNLPIIIFSKESDFLLLYKFLINNNFIQILSPK